MEVKVGVGVGLGVRVEVELGACVEVGVGDIATGEARPGVGECVTMGD